MNLHRKERSRIEFIHICFLALSLAIAWSYQYFEAGNSLVSRISYIITDAPWMPPRIKGAPLIGEHYFGDFSLAYGYGKTWDPYGLELAAQHSPTGQLILKGFSFFPIHVAFVLYIIASLGTLFAGAWWLMKGVSSKINWESSLSFVLFCIVVTPTLADLDRGNLQSITIGCVAIFIGMGLKGRLRTGLIFLLIAVSLKPYLILLGLAFLKRDNVRHHVVILSIFAFLNLALMQAFTGNIFLGLRQLAGAIARYAGEAGLGMIAHSGSLVGSLYRNLEFYIGTDQAYKILGENVLLIQALSLASVALGMVIWYQSSFPAWVRIGGLFSIMTVAQAGSFTYQWAWVGLVVLVFLYDTSEKSLNFFPRLSPLYIQALAFFALIPTWIMLVGPSGSSRAIANFLLLSPLVVLGMAAVLIWNLKRVQLDPAEN